MDDTIQESTDEFNESDRTSNDATNPNSQRTYQDDFDNNEIDTDPIIDEETDSTANELGIPENEFKDELDKYADDDTGTGDDDMREAIEDRDEDDDNGASTA